MEKVGIGMAVRADQVQLKDKQRRDMTMEVLGVVDMVMVDTQWKT